jgi:hypothetical protein
MSRARNQTSAATISAWPMSCGSFMPTKRVNERAITATYQTPPSTAPARPPPSCEITLAIRPPSATTAISDIIRPT